MNNKERLNAILHYQDYDRLPVVHFGFWGETLAKWAEEGHITWDEARGWGDGSAADKSIGEKLGFDFNYFTCFFINNDITPGFERKVVETLPDGARKVRNHIGAVIIEKDDAGS